MGKPKKYNSKQLTEHLRQLAAEAHDWSEDGIITHGEALAKLLWKRALGWTEKTVDEEGNEKEVYHKPEAWAMQFVYERMEGKTPQSTPDDEGRKRRAKDDVRDLAKSRLNSLAKSAAGSEDGLKKKGPPKRKKGDDDAE